MPNIMALGMVAVGAAVLTLQVPRLPPYEFAAMPSLAAALAAIYCMATGRWSAYLAMAVLASIASLSTASHWESHLLPEDCERQRIQLDGHVLGLPARIEGQREPTYQLILKVHAISTRSCAGPRYLRLYLPETQLLDLAGESARLMAGDRLSASARLRRPWGAVNPRSRRGELPYVIQGIHGVGGIVELQVYQSSAKITPMTLIHGLRDSISRWIRSTASKEMSPLIAALAIGDRRFMTPVHWELLQTFGITHLLVISGLHVTLLAVPGWWAGRLLAATLALVGLPSSHDRWLAPCCAFLLAAAYSFLGGLSLPTIRALLMLALALVPRVLGRPLEGGRIFGACAIGLLLLNPLSVLGPSFWLSLGAVGLLLWLSLWRENRSVWRHLVETQAFLILAMVPLSLFWFDAASSLGAAINLVAIPLVTWCLLPMLLSAIFLFMLNIQIGSYLIEYVDNIAALSWNFLLLWQHRGPPTGLLLSTPPALILGAAIGASLLLVLPRFPRRRRICSLLLLPLILTPIPRPAAAVLITVLDVGQGTAVLVRHGRRYALYDTGGSAGPGRPRIASSLMPLLRFEHASQLELMFISHADDDHGGGEAFVRENLSLRRIYRGGSSDTGDRRCQLGAQIPLGRDVWLQSLSTALPGDSDNNGSCVLLLAAHGRRILLPGDIHRRREVDLVAYWHRNLRADVLLAAHHGSRTSSSRLFMRAVGPESVVVTSGRANRFGHPAPEVLEVVNTQGANLLNTAIDGAITFVVEPSGTLRCFRERHRLSPFWRRGKGNRNCGVLPAPAQV